MSEPRDPRETAMTAAVDAVSGFGPEVGTQLAGRYRVLGTLGLGATGIVVKAEDLLARELVAIKLLRYDVELDDEKLQRFFREAHSTILLRSEHTARVREIGKLDDGSPYIAMELLEGMDLARLLVANQQLERPFAVQIAGQATAALAEAHGLGIVHRDIKPSNLFVTWRADRTMIVKVLDFGIAKSSTSSTDLLTQRSSLLGTPAYMSPEQIRSASAVDARTDVWSLGVVLYEMVEGRTPFVGRTFADMCIAVATTEPAAMVAAPELAPIVARCLAKAPGDRYATILDLAHALAPLA